MSDFYIDFFIRFSITLFFIALLSYGCYYRVTKNSDFATSFMLFGTGVFVVIYFSHGIAISMGFAFGLFAVFTILRYHTEPISIKEMTYLFLVIAITLLTAAAKTSVSQLILLNSLLCGVAIIIDSNLFSYRHSHKIIQYEKINNIKPESHHLLIADLINRTGLDIVDIDIQDIGFLRDSSKVKIFYKSLSPEKNTHKQELHNTSIK